MKDNYIVEKIVFDLEKKIKDKINNEQLKPSLALISMGNNSGVKSYAKSIIKLCKEFSIETKYLNLEDDNQTQDIIELIESLNNDNDIDGIMILLPLPKHIDQQAISNGINPLKDVDCINTINYGNVFLNDLSLFIPCTAKAVNLMINDIVTDLRGKKICLVNASNVVGLPLSILLSKQGGTPIICNSKTKNLKELMYESDIVICAIGKAKCFDKSYFNPNSIVIDVGISVDENFKLAGDVDYDNVVDHVTYLSHYKHGVGSITSHVLIEHIVESSSK